MKKKLTTHTRSELENLFETILQLKMQLDVESDEYVYYREIRDAVEMILDRPLPFKKVSSW